jgi:methionine salvage enolase-phosphatase E1
MESNCGGFRVLDSYVWAKGYRCSQIQDHITLWIKHMDEMDMAQNKTHK